MLLGALRLENMLTRNSSLFQAKYKKRYQEVKVKR
jgi:hypothetical protein